ncbi:hypothetical protein EMMF5_004961 [Cystobasidiomycetes sp. EMM_F5]
MSILAILLLRVKYTPTYPDELPDLELEIIESGTEEDHLSQDEQETLLQRLREVGEESLGMAMVYTMSMQLKESLTELLIAKASAREMEEQASQLRIQEAELAKPKGTPVTKENFLAWQKRFEVEMAAKREQEQIEFLRTLPPKERKERETIIMRLSGRQIFEHKRGSKDQDEEEDEEGAQLIDISKYDREQRQDDAESDEEDEKGLVYSDSD